MKNELLQKYARLLVKTGVNIQKDQILVVNAPVECAEIVRLIAKIAYEEGAREVVLNWLDDTLLRYKYLFAPNDVFDEYPEWRKEFSVSYAKKGAAFLSISASDPEALKGVDPDRISRANKAASTQLVEYRQRLMANKNVWCVASIPTESWAKKVFPQATGEEAIEKLWEAIFKAVRADLEDPVAAWDQHKQNLKISLDFLNKNNFKALKFNNGIGTDLTIELAENHIWAGGSDKSPEGVEFIANMPTEEVFTAPKKTGANGKVVSSKPLNLNGNLVDKFSFTFENGRIVDYSAEVGYESLKKLIETDEGAHYLGEVALVQYDSPICQSNILFYNTLYDENASCHFAIGKAYPINLKGGTAMNTEELAAAGLNDSLTHVDFMIGTEDLNITGITQDGREIPVFVNGNFAI